MQLSFVVTYFIVTVVCMIMAVILMKEITPDMGRKREIRCFRRFVFWYLVFVVSNSVWIWIQYGYLRLPGTPFSLVNLLAICLVIYYWFLYIETRINPYRVENRRFALVASIPLAAALALIFSSPVTDLVFYYTPSGEYMHGNARAGCALSDPGDSAYRISPASHGLHERAQAILCLDVLLGISADGGPY